MINLGFCKSLDLNEKGDRLVSFWRFCARNFRMGFQKVVTNSCSDQKDSLLPVANSCSGQKDSLLPTANSCSDQKESLLLLQIFAVTKLIAFWSAPTSAGGKRETFCYLRVPVGTFLLTFANRIGLPECAFLLKKQLFCHDQVSLFSGT